MTRARGLAVFALFALFVSACGKPRTEVVVTVTTSGLSLPSDIDAVKITVTDQTAGSQTYESPAQPLCAPGVPTPCVSLPIVLTLRPGPMAPTDAVHVEVIASRAGKTVIDDAATFTFTTGTSQELSFILYRACLGITLCASDTKTGSCGENGNCLAVSATTLTQDPALDAAPFQSIDAGGTDASGLDAARDASGPADATLPPRDQAAAIDLQQAVVDAANPIDLTPTTDLALATDLTSPVDLATSCAIPLPGCLRDMSANLSVATDLAVTDLAVGDLAERPFMKCDTFPVGTNPRGIAVKNGLLAVTNYGSNSVTVLNASGGAPVGTITVGTNPAGLASDTNNNLWVTNFSDNNVTELDPTGARVGTYATGTNPLAVVIDPVGRLWIANQGSSTVTLLSSSGGALGTYGVGTAPTGMAIDKNVNLWVSNLMSNNVTKLSPAGATLGTYAVGTAPTGIAVDGSGNVWVANSADNTITELSGSGQTINTFAAGMKPYGVAIDGSGDVWVADYDGNELTRLSPSGAVLGTYAVGTGPYSIVVDGNGDVWVTNDMSNDVNRLSQNCNAGLPDMSTLDTSTSDMSSSPDLAPLVCASIPFSFGAPTAYPAAYGPLGMVAGDWNGDGKIDLAITDQTNNSVDVLLGDGMGAFAAAAQYSVGSDPISVAAGDWSGDGVLDLAVANENDGTVSLLSGNGDGTFSAGKTLTPVAFTVPENGTPTSVAIADLDGNGHLDIAIAQLGGDNIPVFLGMGGGNFGANIDYATGIFEPEALVVADFNGDGKLNLATANRSGNNVGVVLNNGSGTFGAVAYHAAAAGAWGLAAADFNHDGHIDLVTANDGANNVSVLLGSGGGAFATAVNYAVGSHPEFVTVGDLDGDGKLNLAVTNTGAATVSLLSGNGDGTFAIAGTLTCKLLCTGLPVIADVNRDGRADVVVPGDGAEVFLNTCM